MGQFFFCCFFFKKKEHFLKCCNETQSVGLRNSTRPLQENLEKITHEHVQSLKNNDEVKTLIKKPNEN